MASKKAKAKFQAIIKELKRLENDDALNGASATYTESVKKKLTKQLQALLSEVNASDRASFNRDFRREYFSLLKEMPSKNVGLSSFSLDKLKPEFARAYQLGAQNSLDLITTQNEENMLKLRRLFYDWITLKSTGGDTEKLWEQISLPTNNRIKFIWRDQTSKLAATMDKAVADAYEAICFEWKTRNDNRVVGKPGGIYSKKNINEDMHGDHWARKDKMYYYRERLTPALRKALKLSAFEGAAEDIRDGMPGMPIGCRCYARNYFDLRDIPSQYLKKEV